jgi:hypothetical protein
MRPIRLDRGFQPLSTGEQRMSDQSITSPLSREAQLFNKIETQRLVILDLSDRVERLEMRADGLTPMERVQRRWDQKAGGDKLDRLIVQDREADGQAAWQPIDTAPQDGREILASNLNCIDIVSWWPPSGQVSGWTNRDCERFYPCYWQPLPDHPAGPGDHTPAT